MEIRRPAVAGSFYPAGEQELRKSIRDSYEHPLGPGRLPPLGEETHGVQACVCPHAGYQYSGPVAAHSYLRLSALRRPSLVVVVGPNHYGRGNGLSTFRDGEWETPLGRVAVDSEASEGIVKLTGIVDYSPWSHSLEHSIEVQLPFLQQLYGDGEGKVPFKFLPIMLAFQDKATARDLGKGLAELIKEGSEKGERDVILIASSDLTHYEPANRARDKDLAILKQVKALDLDAFYDVLERRNVTACGFGAIATVMEACKLLGFSRGEVNKYASSGDTSGDNSAVVGYPSVTFLREGTA